MGFMQSAQAHASTSIGGDDIASGRKPIRSLRSSILTPHVPDDDEELGSDSDDD